MSKNTEQKIETVKTVVKDINKEETIVTDHLNSLFVENLPEHPARVTVNGGATVRLSTEFEFARIDVCLELPCHPKDLEATYKYASDWVYNKQCEELKAAQGL